MSPLTQKDLERICREESKKYGWGLILIAREQLRAWVMRERPRRLLDIGCHNRLLEQTVKEWYPEVETFGLDIVRYDVKPTVIASGDHLPFRDGAFDFITMVETLEHIPDYVQALRECHRVLRRRGILFVQSVSCLSKCAYEDDETHFHVLHPNTLCRLGKLLGFKTEESGMINMTFYTVFRKVSKMHHRCMVIVLDGASFVFTNTFVWCMPTVQELFKKGKRAMMYIDVPPITPPVLATMFTGKAPDEHGVLGFTELGRGADIAGRLKVPAVWDIAQAKGLHVKVLNIPISRPPVYINAQLRRVHWVDAWLPPREKFEEVIKTYHDEVKEHAQSDWDLFIVWYPIPDQAHHYFFATIDSKERFVEALKWYNTAFEYALELIELAKPDTWLVVSDHGFTSDFEEYAVHGRKQAVHIRDGLAVTNAEPVPRRPAEVFTWIGRQLHIC